MDSFIFCIIIIEIANDTICTIYRIGSILTDITFLQSG